MSPAGHRPVALPRARQQQRFAQRADVFANAHMLPRDIREFCAIDAAAENLLHAAVVRLGMSARSYHRVLRLARTIADLDGCDRIAAAHVAEGIQYRALDRISRR